MMAATIDRPIPRDVTAEKSVLGACMLASHVLPDVRATLSAGDFYQPQHELLFATICRLADEGRPVDAVTVGAELMQTGDMRRAGGHIYLHELVSAVPTATNATYYAESVRDAARRRRLLEITDRLQSAVLAERGISKDIDRDSMLSQVAAELVQLELLVDEPDSHQPISGLETWADFITRTPQTRHWIVPGLFEKQDVWMLLSPPGAGKSWLSRQLCQCIAAGVHPFRPDTRIMPRRTLLVDWENPPEMVAHQSGPQLRQAERIGGKDVGDRGWVWMRPEGLNLRKAEDARMFERVVAETQPEFIAMGSLYKAFQRGKDDWDTAAEETRAVFDRIRARYGCAFWIEHHMPRPPAGHNGVSGNPFGSTVWERWPGFGRVLKSVAPGSPLFELAMTFRGDRDVRDVPVGLQRGGDLPWQAIFDPEEFEYMRLQEQG